MANNINVNSSASRSAAPRTGTLAPLLPESGLNANTPNTGSLSVGDNPALGGIAPAAPLSQLRNNLPTPS